MNRNRLAILVTGGIAVTGCGVTVELLNSRSAASIVTPHATAQSPSTTTTLTSPADAKPGPLAPPIPLQPQLVVTAGRTTTAALTVSIIDTTGLVRATTSVPEDAQWTIGSGSGAAYWVTGGTLRKLDAHGVVTTVSTVPATESGRVLVSPDGSQWAYATMSQSPANGAVTNRLYRGGVDQATQLIAERIADPNHPSSDAPVLWQYYLESWTARGILVERQPVGGCGCGVPFDMQMSAGYSAFIDPLAGTATPITQSEACPLSGVAADGTAACFTTSSAGTSTSMRLTAAAHTVAQYPLSGTTMGGDATFDGSTLAYATVPAGAGGCGGPDWREATTLRVMDTSTGAAHVVGRTGLAPVAWLKTGAILATLSSSGASAGTASTSVVSVDALTGHLTTIAAQADRVVGLA